MAGRSDEEVGEKKLFDSGADATGYSIPQRVLEWAFATSPLSECKWLGRGPKCPGVA